MTSAFEISKSFAALLGAEVRQAATGSLLGLEHEYRLLKNGEPVDFRRLIHGLNVPGRRLDPGDANAYRLGSGLALTCDDAEAEIATPPLTLAPGFSREIEAWSAMGRRQLVALLPSGIEVDGYSTHLSVSAEDDAAHRILELFVLVFAPLLMLTFDCPDSQGIYVRPRPGRIELCGDYVGGDYLGASAALFAGGVRATQLALPGQSDGSLPKLHLRLRPARGRFGLYIGRQHAFGFDFYRAGRSDRLPLTDGGTIRLDEYARLVWRAARAALGNDAASSDVEFMDGIASGAIPFRASNASGGEDRDLTGANPSHWLGGVIERRSRPSLSLSAVAATWDFTIFRVAGGPRAAFAALPRTSLPAFFDAFDSGRLDFLLDAYLDAPFTGRVLRNRHEALAPGLWDALDPTQALLPQEPDPLTGRYEPQPVAPEGQRLGKPARPGKPVVLGARPGKPLVSQDRPGKPAVTIPTAPASTAEALPPSLPTPLPAQPTPPAPIADSRPEPPLTLDTEGPPPPPPTLAAPPISPAEPPPPPPPGGPIRWLVPIGAVVAGVITAVAVVASGVFSGGAPAVPMPTATRTPTPVRTETPRPTASPTANFTASPTVRPLETATRPPLLASPTRPPTETPRPTEPPPPTATSPATATPKPTEPAVPTPTSTLLPAATPTPCFAAGAVCTPTPSPTRTATPTGPGAIN